ncbi:hypothetical protein [Nocardioides pacificus]
MEDSAKEQRRRRYGVLPPVAAAGAWVAVAPKDVTDHPEPADAGILGGGGGFGGIGDGGD